MHSISQHKGLNTLWYKEKAPTWQPSNFHPSNNVFQNRDAFIHEAEQKFNSYDRDQSGFLEKKEFKKAIQSLGLDKKQSKLLGRMIEKDTSGRVGIEEFVNSYLYAKGGGEILEPGLKEKYEQQEEELTQPNQ